MLVHVGSRCLGGPCGRAANCILGTVLVPWFSLEGSGPGGIGSMRYVGGGRVQINVCVRVLANENTPKHVVFDQSMAFVE